MDSDIYIERKSVPINYPVITNNPSSMVMWTQPVLSWADWAWVGVGFPQMGPIWGLLEVELIQLGLTWVKCSMVEVGHIGLDPVGQIIHGIRLGYSFWVLVGLTL